MPLDEGKWTMTQPDSSRAESSAPATAEADRVRFELRGSPVADYVFVPDDIRQHSPRPFFDGLRTLAGHLVSESQPADHPWHRGLSWALPVVNDENFWGGPTYVRGSGYVHLANNGSQQHQRFTEVGPNRDGACKAAPEPAPDEVWFAEDVRWDTEAGGRLVDETRTVSISRADQSSWVLTFSTVMANATSGVLSFGSPTTNGRPNSGYGGLFWRGPAAFTGARVISPLGLGDEGMRGTRAPWMGLSGLAGSHAAGVTVVIVNGERNERTPPEWFVRTEEYPCLCPAPFFRSTYELAAGATLRLDYAVVIADGVSDAARGAHLAEYGRAALARVYR